MKKLAEELICSDCGKKFIYRASLSKMSKPRICLKCWKKLKEKQKTAAMELENRKWHIQKEKEQKLYEVELGKWNLKEITEIHPLSNKVLYIIGNGFDLMHGVKSSYYDFRDSLSKRSRLRFSLEHFINKDDLWGDFEESLAHFNVEAMSNQYIVDDFLDINGAYDEDASAADYFLAMEMAANPISTVANELPRRFRKWVESLEVNTADRPLQDLICSGKVLCFNYTEFIESLYGICETDICYIHGCRRKRKYQPHEELVLGHMEGDSDEEYNFYEKRINQRDVYKRAMIEDAQEGIIRMISGHDDALTKNSKNIISSNIKFFDELADLKQVIIIGHSLSEVDIDYFVEITKHIRNLEDVNWYFGCHNLRNLNNFSQLIRRLGLLHTNMFVFRTDCIHTIPLVTTEKTYKKQRCNTVCDLLVSDKWIVKSNGNILIIEDRKTNIIQYEAVLSNISKAFFVDGDKYLFVIVKGSYAGILLFRIDEQRRWNLVNELETIPNQNLINRRLQHVYMDEETLIFVYNNRVRKYSLNTGEIIENRAMRNAKWNGSKETVEISNLLAP